MRDSLSWASVNGIVIAFTIVKSYYNVIYTKFGSLCLSENEIVIIYDSNESRPCCGANPRNLGSGPLFLFFQFGVLDRTTRQRASLQHCCGRLNSRLPPLSSNTRNETKGDPAADSIPFHSIPFIAPCQREIGTSTVKRQIHT